MFKSKNTRRPRKPAWFIARAAFVAAALFFAGLTAFYWAKPNWDVSPFFALVLAIGFLVSAIVTPTVVPKLAYARGWICAGLTAVCMVFGAIDSVGFAGAVRGLEKDLTQSAFDQATQAYETQRTNLETELTAAKAKVNAVPPIDMSDKPGPLTTKARTEAREAEIRPLRAERDAIQKRLDTLEAPAREDLWNDDLIMAFSFFVQFALTIGLLTLEAARESVYRRELKAYEDGLAAKRKQKEKDKKAEERAAQKAAKPQPIRPYLVAANENAR